MAEYPVLIGLTDKNLAPVAFNVASPALNELPSISSATPNITKYLDRDQSGSPDSQNEPPIVYKPAAAILDAHKLLFDP